MDIEHLEIDCMHLHGWEDAGCNWGQWSERCI